jgi:hypothetical protein
MGNKDGALSTLFGAAAYMNELCRGFSPYISTSFSESVSFQHREIKLQRVFTRSIAHSPAFSTVLLDVRLLVIAGSYSDKSHIGGGAGWYWHGAD